MAPNGTASETVPGAISLGRARGVETLWTETWRRFRRHRLAIFGAAVLAVMVAAVLLGPFVYRVPINEIDFRAKLKGPSLAHPLGADDLGQDLLARMLYGGRISLAVGIAAMLARAASRAMLPACACRTSPPRRSWSTVLAACISSPSIKRPRAASCAG